MCVGKAEGGPQPVLEIALIGEVYQFRIVDSEYKRRWVYVDLSHLFNFQSFGAF